MDSRVCRGLPPCIRLANGKRVFNMSSRNGDKSQFGRLRKQKIARRVRVRELRKAIAEKTGVDPLRRKP